MNAATLEFIRTHANDDIRQLALGRVHADVNLREALAQIEGRQVAARKLPTCAATDGFLFPPRLSLEQCSSEATARYKRDIVARLAQSLPLGRAGEGPALSFIDLTGGLGIDFMTIAPLFEDATYVEHNSDLCELARHNLPLMGCSHAKVICEEVAVGCSSIASQQYTMMLVDPARRDAVGRKVARIEDCTPDVCALQGKLRSHARYTLIKLSPMLDLTAAFRALNGIKEAHVVSVDGECKELLLVMCEGERDNNQIPIYCVDLRGQATTFCFTFNEEKAMFQGNAAFLSPDRVGLTGRFLYEPNASILKAGAFKTVCRRFAVQKLAPDTHLYTSATLIDDFPGRRWRIIDSASFAKKDLRRLLAGIDAADLSVRGFPASVAMLRRQLHLREGGNSHFIASTLVDSTKILFRVERV